MAARRTSRSRPRRRLAAVALALAALIVLVAPAAADPPAVVQTPPDITAEATSASGATVSFDISSDATDENGTPTWSCSPGSGSVFPFGSTPVSCTFSDPVTNETTPVGFNVIVQDTTPPAMSGTPSDITVEGGSSGAAVTYSAPTANDIVDGSVPVNCAPGSGSNFPVTTTTVTCTATDGHGNSAQTSFNVTVQDTAPTISGTPANIATQATSASGATVTYTPPTATAGGGGSAPVSCQPGSGSVFAITTTTVTCTATDSYGNSSQKTFSVTVQDTTAPVISGTPANITAQGGATGVAVTYASPTATDAVDGTDPVGCAPASGSTFPVATTTVTCTATDAHGNSAHTTFTVTVQDTPPVITGTPANITAQGGSTGVAVTYTSPTATAAGGASVPVGCVPASGSTFPVATTTVTCTATDTHGNSAHTTFTVTVQDTPPVITGTPANITAQAANASGAVVTFATPSATDASNAKVAVICAPASGSTFAIATTTDTCTATDSHGNASHTTFTVTVQDTTAPVLTLPTAMTVSAVGPSGAPVAYAVSATDAVSGPATVTCSPASGATFPLGTTTVNCSAPDTHGNTATGSFTVTVSDTLPPLLNVPGTIAVQATSSSGAAVPFLVTALDAVDGTVTPSCSPASGATFPLGQTTVTCTAKDKAGNTASESFLVSVTTAPPPPPGPDHTPPALNVPAPFTAFAQGPKGAAVVFSTSAVDVADGSVPVTCAPASGSVFLIGATTVRCSAQDSHGNMATKSFTVLVVDKTPPPAVVGLTVLAKSGDTQLSWQTPNSPDIDHIEVVRTKLPNGSPIVLFKGHASSFTDTHALNGVRYRYTVYSVDSIGNRAGLEVIVEPAPVVLVKPADGAKLTHAPVLLWVPAAKADYYNLQLYRNGAKVLSVWPSTNQYSLGSTWKFAGKNLKLVPGSYRWYVWPGLGAAASRTFGTLLGSSTFVVTK
jgi:hypothetical protein